MEINKKGITLIALVITIIVLMILAGVSISILIGDNGILTKATTASEEIKKAGALEKVQIAVVSSFGKDGKINIEEFKNSLNNVEGIDKSTIKDSLPMTVTVDGIDVTIDAKGKATLETSEGGETGSLPSTADTKPYLPGSDFTQVEGTDLNTGLVIKDTTGNSYVWVEVPKTIFTTATSNTDYTNIEKDMIEYAKDYRKSEWMDEWYLECGLIESEYYKLKNKMLESIYDNGGFWISQYEIGMETLPEINGLDGTVKYPDPVSKEGAYGYNCATMDYAQLLSSQMNSGNYNSSLLFGIQWDLTMKYLEVKGAKTQAQIKTDSVEWGNYKNATFEITKGKYIIDFNYIDVSGTYKKAENTMVLLTTGATNRNCVMNIYDLAGNLSEYTLERSSDEAAFKVTIRGGDYSYNDIPAASREMMQVNSSYSQMGFRTAIY